MYSQQLQDTLEAMNGVNAVDKDQGPSRISQNEVVEIHILQGEIVRVGRE